MKKQITLGLLAVATMSGGVADYQKDGFQPVKVPTYPKSNLNSLFASTTDTAATNKNQFSTIHAAEKVADATSVRSIDSLFTRVPSSHEIDELIHSADSVGLLRTIQSLISNDSIPCDQALQYLLEVLGRVKCAVEKKSFGADQLKIIIDGAKNEIARLNKLIGGLESDIKDLWLDELHHKLSDVISDLERSYNEFNYVESQIAPNEAKVAGWEKEIHILRKSSDEERNRIANDRLKLTAAENLIKDLRRQLAAAEENKAYVEQSIFSSESTIAKNNVAIEGAQAKIDELEKQIRSLRNTADSLRRKTSNLQIQVERLRTDITVSETKEERLEKKIQDYKNRINIEEKKLKDEEYSDLNRQISVLQRSLPGISDEINRQYYYCYGDGAVTVEKTGSTVVYVVKGKDFKNLLEKTYKVDFSDFACCEEKGLRKDSYKPHKPEHHAVKKEYKFLSVDIFSPEYEEEVGKPFPEEEKKKYEKKTETKMENDFSCWEDSDVSGRGIITEVNGNVYKIKSYAGSVIQDVFVKVGACTVIMSTVKSPRTGMQIAYNGKSKDGIVQAVMTTVW